MKFFEKEINKRMQIQVAKAIVVAAFVVIAGAIKLRVYGNIAAVPSVDKAILLGALLGGEFSAIRAILSYRKVLKTKQALEEMHIKETDERNRLLVLKTCRATVQLTYTTLAASGLVASFYSLPVAITLVAVLLFVHFLYRVLLAYYSSKI